MNNSPSFTCIQHRIYGLSRFITVLFIPVFLSCASGSTLLFELNPSAPYVGSYSAIDELSDEEYLNHVRDAVLMVSAGNPWGMRLVEFLDERGVLIGERELKRKDEDPPGDKFWVTTYKPDPGEHVYFFTDEPKSLNLPRIPIGEVFLGIIVGHELQHAYDAIVFPELTKPGTTNYIFMEMRAYRFCIDLLNTYSNNAFQEEIQRGLEEKEYKVITGHLLRPKDSLTERLDLLFGPSSPWEIYQRTTEYVLALTYANCNNQVERMHATYTFLSVAGMRLDPPGYESYARPEHNGLDVTCEVGEEIESPVQGTVTAHLLDTRPTSDWQGIVVQGTGPDEDRTVRILGLSPTKAVGDEVNQGDVIGIAQNPRDSFKKLLPHLHVELYVEGKREKAHWVRNERWTDRSEAYPASGGYASRTHEGVKLLRKGLKHEEEREYREAIEYFIQVIPYPWWEIQYHHIHHYIARCHAALGEYEDAIKAQKILIGFLEKKLEYSNGAIPHEELGTIGASSPSNMLEIQLNHHRQNLSAYERGLDTIFVY